MIKPTQNISCDNCPAMQQSIFKDLPSAELAEMLSYKNCNTYLKGDKIFSENAFPRGLFCLQSGKVKLTQCGHDGKEQILHMAHIGNPMGYRALLGHDKLSCSAIALEDANVCFIPKENFHYLAENNPKLTLAIVHLLSSELKKAERNITSATQQHVKNRLAQTLIFLSENYGFEADKKTINIAIKREELANLVGTTRETATRLLYELQSQKYLLLVGKKIQLLEESKLVALANSIH